MSVVVPGLVTLPALALSVSVWGFGHSNAFTTRQQSSQSAWQAPACAEACAVVQSSIAAELPVLDM